MPTVKELIQESDYYDLIGREFTDPSGSVVKISSVDFEDETIDCLCATSGVTVTYDMDTPMELLLVGGKVPFELLDLGFAAAMCRNWEAGIKDGRIANDWQFLPANDETRDRYVAKVLRHLRAYVEAGDNYGARCEHLAAIACNANILWHIEGRGE